MSGIDVLLLVVIAFLLVLISRLNGRVKELEGKLRQPPENMGEADRELFDLLRQGKDIQAVKRTRELFGYSLLDAKQYVDALKDKQN